MAFETIRGESGVDFIGTDGTDLLFVINEPVDQATGTTNTAGKITVDAQGGNDNVDMTNETGVIGNAEVRLGEGDDIFTVGFTTANNERLKDSFVNGGPGNDDISPEGAINTKLRGNEGEDDFFLDGNYTSTTINGNSGEDSFDLAFNVTLSDSKITGGADNDGQMDFDNFGLSILAADSVITGAKGNDQIDIGNIAAGSTNLRVSGGEGNDVINVDNTVDAPTNVSYNGAKGQDTFNFAGTNVADATSKGGDDADIYNFQGAGEITSAGEAGDDTFNIVADVAGDQNMTGGAGGDTLNFTAPTGEHTWVVNAISESNIAGHDVFGTSLTAMVGDFTIDLSSNGTGERLVGNRLLSGTETVAASAAATALPGADVITIGAGALGTDIDSVEDIITALNAGTGALQPSISDVGAFTGVAAQNNFGQMTAQAVAIDALDTGDLADSVFIVLSNNNTILDSGDVLFETAATAAGAAAELAEFVINVNEGF